MGWLRKDAAASIVFWPLLRVAQALVVVQVLVGLLLLARGATAPDGLHVAYGVSPLLITLVSEAMRAGVAQRELEGVEDVDALERERAGGAGAPGGARRDGRDDRRRPADPHAGAAGLSDGRLSAPSAAAGELCRGRPAPTLMLVRVVFLDARLVDVRVRVGHVAVAVLVLVLGVVVIVTRVRVRVGHVAVAVLVRVGPVVLVLVHAREGSPGAARNRASLGDSRVPEAEHQAERPEARESARPGTRAR